MTLISERENSSLSSVRRIQFEKLALSLLQSEAALDKKGILIGSEAGDRYKFIDAVVPSGMFELPGPTLIEVNRDWPVNILIKRVLSRARLGGVDFNSLLICSQRAPNESSVFKGYIIRMEKEYSCKIMIKWKADIEGLEMKHPDVAFAFNKTTFDKAIAVYKSKDDSAENELHIKALASALIEEQLVLFIGAGVSLSAGLPSWNDLLSRLAGQLIKSHSSRDDVSGEIMNFFKNEAPASPLIVARILQDSLKDFPEKVRDALYEKYDDTRTSALISEIGRLCAPERANNGLSAVVNYNFDDLLEKELERSGINYHVIITEEGTATKNELPIYHPHGFLPRREKITDIYSSALVLSEDAYHTQFIDSYSWTNITQLGLMRNGVCLFVGLSMTDPNLRRLLEISQRKRPGKMHYAILKNHWDSYPKSKNDAKMKEMANIFRNLEEASFKKLGVAIIWVNDYSEITKVIKRIKKPNGV